MPSKRQRRKRIAEKARNSEARDAGVLCQTGLNAPIHGSCDTGRNEIAVIAEGLVQELQEDCNVANAGDCTSRQQNKSEQGKQMSRAGRPPLQSASTCSEKDMQHVTHAARSMSLNADEHDAVGFNERATTDERSEFNEYSHACIYGHAVKLA